MRAKIKINILFFYIPWILLVLNTLLAQSYLEKFSSRLITISCIGLMLTKILISKRHIPKELLNCFILILIGTFIAYVSKDKRILWLAIALSASDDVDYYSLVYYTYFSMFIGFCVVVSSCILLYGNIGTSLKGGLALGMGHPSILHGTLAIICSMFVYLKWSKIKIRHLLVLEVINYLFYIPSMSRVGFLCLSATVVMVLIYKLYPKRIIILTIGIVTIAFSIIFTFLPIIYEFYPNNSFLVAIDELMTGRLWQGRWYYRISGVRLFGNYYPELYADNPFALLDMGFFRLLLEYGLLAYILIFLGYIKILKESYLARNYGMFFLLVSMMIFSWIESLGTYVFFNVTLMSLSCLIFKRNKNNLKNYIKIRQKIIRWR